MSFPYDLIYYFKNGAWHAGIPNCYPDYKDIDTLLADVKRMGYKAVKGSSKIGAPEGESYEEVNRG